MTTEQKKAVCLISGGLDSTVATAMAIEQGYQPIFLFLRYGQKTAEKEEWCLDQLVKHWKVKQVYKVDLPWIKNFGGSALLDKNIPLDERNFRLEYVPFRNSIFLGVATALAEVQGADIIVVGSTGGDHICPDNSPEFIDAYQKVVEKGTMLKKDIKIFHPLTETDKTGAIKLGNNMKVPFEFTWSCHNGTEVACGHCSNCKARIEAFELNLMKDPIAYKSES
ncbi:MAG: 7-cyano-7-deazaguanine synthase [Candidatus Shapirobacteria bacterium]|jgi:7-cyano-7-deazaguanine synthase